MPRAGPRAAVCEQCVDDAEVPERESGAKGVVVIRGWVSTAGREERSDDRRVAIVGG
jgi:hypothetical protein